MHSAEHQTSIPPWPNSWAWIVYPNPPRIQGCAQHVAMAGRRERVDGVRARAGAGMNCLNDLVLHACSCANRTLGSLLPASTISSTLRLASLASQSTIRAGTPAARADTRLRTRHGGLNRWLEFIMILILRREETFLDEIIALAFVEPSTKAKSHHLW